MRYFDSGVLVKLYRQEPNSSIAASHVKSTPQPIAISGLHVLEIRNAINLMLGRGEINVAGCQQAQAEFSRDLVMGVFVEAVLDWNKVIARAAQLSSAHTPASLCRSLDALHVAIALEIGATEICTFDQRQAELARLVGLTVIA